MGETTDDGFLYKPSLGATGTVEKTKFDDGLDRVDNRLDNEIWVGDPDYGATIASAVTAIGVIEATLRIPPAAQSIAVNTTIPANVLYRPEKTGIATVATTKTLTINGGVDESVGHYQIFAWEGTGTFVFGKPQVFKFAWFGVSTSAADNSAAIAKAVACVPAGSKLLWPGGEIITTLPWIDGSDIPYGLSFEGVGTPEIDESSHTKVSSLTGGTILKYTGADKWAYIKGTTPTGKWTFKDFAIWCTQTTATGLQINDVTASMVGGPPPPAGAIVRGLVFDNVHLYGGGDDVTHAGAYGLALTGVYNSEIKPNCYGRNWKRAILQRDCDGNKCGARLLGNDRHIHNETTTPGALQYGNENVFTGLIHYSLDYGETTQYLIWDNCYKTKFDNMQLEPKTGNTTFYFDGLWTRLVGCRMSRAGTDSPDSAGRFGPNARNIVIDNLDGDCYAVSDGTWPYFVVDDIGGSDDPFGTKDFSIYFVNCGLKVCTLVPKHWRVKFDGTWQSQYPSATGWDDTDKRYIWTARTSTWANLFMFNALRGLSDYRRTDFFACAFTRNIIGKGRTSAGGGTGDYYSTAQIVADADAWRGYAIKLRRVGTVSDFAGFSFVVGVDIPIGGTIRYETRYKVDAAGTLGIKIYNTTKNLDVDSIAVGTSTTYDTIRGHVNLYSYTPGAGTFEAGDVLTVTFYQSVDDKNGYLSYFILTPESNYIISNAFAGKTQTVTYAATIDIDCAKGNVIYVDASTNATMAINAPTNGVDNQEIDIHIVKAANTLTLTYNTGIKASYGTGGSPMPASTQALITLKKRGTVWIQKGTPTAEAL